MKPTHKIKFLVYIPAFIASIAMAVLIAQSGAVELLIEKSHFSYLVASFISGIFFVSLFTAAPATVAFFEIAHTGVPIGLMAVLGGLGAMVGDWGMFQVIKLGVSENLMKYFQIHSHGYFKKLFKIRLFSYLLVFIGGFIIMTPLPDEIGLGMMGFSKAKTWLVIALSFVLNTIGIYALGALARI